MKKTLFGIVSGSLLALAAAAPSFAATTLGVNSHQQAVNSANCVAVDSAQVTHNGLVVRMQAQSGMRGALVQGLQDTCNGASSK